jgi:hypothetical protein
MIIVGGTYIEECKWPESHRLMGSGARAALVVSDVSPGSELYTYVDPANRDDLKFTMRNVKPRLRTRRDPITFYYEHPLTSPPEQQPNKPLSSKGPPWTITGDTVLAFPLRECKVLVNADRAVIEISPRNDERIERGRIGTLALIAGQDGLPDPSSATAPDLRSRAEGWLIKYGAELIIVRRQAGGGVLFDGKREWDIPAYVAWNWFKIGAGNVFCAMFTHYWGEQKMDALRAGELPRYAILRWLDHRGHSEVLVFGPEGERLERGTEIPDLLDLYSDHCFFQVRIVRRRALIDIAAALKGVPLGTR